MGTEHPDTRVAGEGSGLGRHHRCPGAARGAKGHQLARWPRGGLLVALLFLLALPVAAQTATPYEGYNLFAPMGATDTYLMDNDGTIVHTWTSSYPPGLSVYLLEDSTLLRTANPGSTEFDSGGAGGRVERFSWDGELLWEFDYNDTTHRFHHDMERLPNGNILMIAWELRTSAQAIAAGRKPSLLTDGELWPDHIIEVQPTGAAGGAIVWEWHVWDHLVQDYDAAKANYGVVADHPELVDLNYATDDNADWNHANGIDYNAELDQIVISVRRFSELWVIDHSTTTAEAASHSGGSSGKGGDLLYRWGNPQTYGAGTASDQKLFGQHDTEWIGAGLPGEGNILILNNGGSRPGGNYSSVEEVAVPVAPNGSYPLAAGSAYGPATASWTYTATPPTSFYARALSGSQRLPNGSTLICNGPSGIFLEVNSAGETVWEHNYGSNTFRVERYGLDYVGLNGTDLDDGEPPIISDASFDVSASCGDGTAVGTVAATDPDGSGALSFTFTDGNEDAVFAIGDTTGQITVADSGGLDNETTPTYRLTVEVRDGDGLSARALVEVFVYSGWLFTLAVADGQSQDRAQLGVTTNGTAAFDNEVDALAAPGARIFLVGPDGTHDELRRDLRGSSDGAKWFLVVMAGTNDVVLTWAADMVPASGLQMQEVAVGDGTPIPDTVTDLAVVSSLTIGRGAIRMFRIMPSPVDFSLSLAKGWNLLSLPIEPVDPAVDVVLSGADTGGQVWTWEPALGRDNGGYSAATQFVPLVGYWVYARAPVTIVVTGSVLANTAVEPAIGWSLVGVAKETLLGEVPGFSSLWWRWDSLALRYRAVPADGLLLPGRGYWTVVTE